MTHICVSKVTIIVSDNGLSPGRRQAIIWNNAGILLIGPLGTYFTGILIEIHTFSFKKMHLKMSSGKWRPFCLGLNVLTILWLSLPYWPNPDSKVHRANMGPIWGRQDPGGPHDGPMNFAIWECLCYSTNMNDWYKRGKSFFIKPCAPGQIVSEYQWHSKW